MIPLTPTNPHACAVFATLSLFFSLYILPLSPFLTFLPSTSFRFVYSELDKGDGSNWVVNDDSLTQCTANGRPIPTASYSYGKNNMREELFVVFFHLHL